MKPRAVININGEEVVMDNYYRAFYEKDGLSIAVNKEGKILEIQNLNEDKIAKVFNKDFAVFVGPSETVTLTSFYFSDPELNFTLKQRSPVRHSDEDEDAEEPLEGWDCHD